jgi:N-acyl-L-homoserine lactone synthetase
MASGCERIRAAARDFEVAMADTQERLEAAYRLRHQVYCIERGYEEGDGALETDRFDARSGHVLLTQRSTGRVVGTVRVVAPSLHGPSADLPMQRFCSSDMFQRLPMGSTGEISRFSISKDLRDAACTGNALLRLGLMQGILRLSVDMGITHWCAVMEHTLLRLLRVSAIHFQPLGPAIEHHGLRQPSFGRIDTVLARIRRERPAAWDYFTDGGSLWQETEEEACAA